MLCLHNQDLKLRKVLGCGFGRSLLYYHVVLPLRARLYLESFSDLKHRDFTFVKRHLCTVAFPKFFTLPN